MPRAERGSAPGRAVCPWLAHRAGRGGEAVLGEGGDEHVHARSTVGARGLELGGIPALQLVHALLGEPAHRALARLRCQEAQRLGGEVVVVGLEGLVARLGEHVAACRATAAAVGYDQLTLGDEAGVGEVV